MRRPNIVLLYTDQQRWDALGANGNQEIRTPHLDQLAAEGFSLDHYYVQNPVCMPSRVSFLTGQYPGTLGILRNGVPVPQDTLTLPHLLHNYGYRSANIGKLHFLPHANRDHRTPHPSYGFGHLEISDEPGCYEDAYRSWVRRKAPEYLDHISLGLPPATAEWQRVMGSEDGIVHPVQGARGDYDGPFAFEAPEELTHGAFVAEQTIEFLQRQDGDVPFFCIAGFYSPHAPLVAPQRYLDLYNPASLSLPAFPSELEARRPGSRFSDERLQAVRQGYYAMVSEVDQQVGRILQSLDRLGLREDTIVIFTSDHGEWLGEHLLYGKGYPAHDCISRVPFIGRWPKAGVRPGERVQDIVEAVDVVPTLLDSAGIPVPGHLQGRSFLPAVRGSCTSGHRSALTEGSGWKTLRTDGYRYVCHADGREFLYGLESSPDGYSEVSKDPVHARALAGLRAELLQRLLERERPLPRSWPY